MRPLRRPPVEARRRWEELRRTVKAKAFISDLAASKKSPASEDFEPAWTDSKWADAVAEAQDGLCVWCTMKPQEGGHVGAIDHIRPRAVVTRAIGEVGEEIGFRGRVEGRPVRPEPPLRGYYWRAYDPENLAFSCERCNSGWKRTLWPVRPWREETSWRVPEPQIEEDELILNPFSEGFNPFMHFQFGALGNMLPRAGDERAEVTIAVLGLDRPALCQVREKIYRNLSTDLMSVVRALRDSAPDSGKEQMLRRFAERGAWSSSQAAFYRAALKRCLQDVELSWSDLRVAWDRRGLAGDIVEPPDDAWVE